MGIKQDDASPIDKILSRSLHHPNRWRGPIAGKFLYIYPQHNPAQAPIIDGLTRKIAAAFRKAVDGDGPYCGFHTCRCGAHSDNVEHVLPNGWQTNSLCTHYIAYHRHDVPAEILAFVNHLPYGEVEPTQLELAPPDLEYMARRRTRYNAPPLPTPELLLQLFDEMLTRARRMGS